MSGVTIESPLRTNLPITATLSDSLRARIEAQVSREHSLEQEVAVARVMLQDDLNIYDSIMLQLESRQITPQSAIAALGSIRAVIMMRVEQIARIAQTHHRISQRAEDSYTASEVHQLIFKVLHSFEQIAKRDQHIFTSVNFDVKLWITELASMIDQRLDAGLESMTGLEPADLEAEAMDDTVPAGPKLLEA